MKASKLTPYADVISDLVASGAKNDSIRSELERRGCAVSLETVRDWIIGKGLRQRNEGRGRPRKQIRQLLPILPAMLPHKAEKTSVPVAFHRFLSPYADNDVCRFLARTELGIPDCESCPALSEQDLARWASKLGKARVNLLVDLEFCLIAFWCASLPNIPGPADDRCERWYQQLALEAFRIRQVMRRAVALPVS